MHNLCRKPAVKKSPKKVIVAKTILQKIIREIKRNHPAMMTAAHLVLHVLLL